MPSRLSWNWSASPSCRARRGKINSQRSSARRSTRRWDRAFINWSIRSSAPSASFSCRWGAISRACNMKLCSTASACERRTGNRMTSDTPQVSLRDATPDDDEFLANLYGSLRQQELDLTGWDAAQRDAFIRMQFAAQQTHYRTHYPTGIHQIILLDGL